MKISQISTQSVYNNLRHSMSNLQRELIAAQKEVSAGVVADAGLSLGAGNGRRVSLVQDIDRLNAIIDTNSLTKNRLEMSISAIGSVNEISQSLLSSLTASVGQGNLAELVEQSGSSAISAIADILNTTVNGEAIFGGINSTSQPISDFDTGGAKLALDTAFQSFFGFAKTDPAAGAITAATMSDFLDTEIAPMFANAGWVNNFSQASSQSITARIGIDESIEGSINANESGFQNAMFAAVIASEFSSASLSGEATSASAQMAIRLIGVASAQMANLQGKAGLLSGRIEGATTRLNVQIDEFTRAADQMVAVDPYEAATMLNSLITQIEASYTLTGRVQQLSLMNYIR